MADMIRIPKGMLDLTLRRDSFNDEARTVDVIWSTGEAVKRYGYRDGYFLEELSMEPKHVRLGRLNAGASLLDSHNGYSMDGRIGAIVPGTARIDGGKGYATVKFSRRERGEQMMQDLRDGLPLPLSAGYRIHKFERIEGGKDSLPILRALDWEPTEISVVAIPAETSTHARRSADESFDCVLVRSIETQRMAAGARMRMQARFIAL